MSLQSTLLSYGVTAVIASGGFAWFVHHERVKGATTCEASVKVATERAAEEGKAKTLLWKTKFEEASSTYEEALSSVIDERERALGELRKRQARRPDVSGPSPSTNCAGVTGLQLAAGDAEFLTRYAAGAAEQAAALKQCLVGWPR